MIEPTNNNSTVNQTSNSMEIDETRKLRAVTLIQNHFRRIQALNPLSKLDPTFSSKDVHEEGTLDALFTDLENHIKSGKNYKEWRFTHNLMNILYNMAGDTLQNMHNDTPALDTLFNTSCDLYVASLNPGNDSFSIKALIMGHLKLRAHQQDTEEALVFLS